MTGPSGATYVPPIWLAVWQTDHQDRMRFSLRLPGTEEEIYTFATTVPAASDREPGTTLLHHLGLGSVPGSPWHWECERHRWTRQVYPVAEATEKAILGGTMRT